MDILQRRIFLLGTLLLFLLLASCSPANAQAQRQRANPNKVTINRASYEGWPNAYTLTNGTVEVVVVPSIARVMRYGYVGGPNILWNNREALGKPVVPDANWENIGGDKIWPWPQDEWTKRQGAGWPPPPATDGVPHTATILGSDTLRLISPPVVGFGVRVVRDITLAATGTDVTIVSRLEKIRDGAAFPVASWSIMQIPYPSLMLARRTPGSTLAKGWKEYGDGDWSRLENVGDDVLAILHQEKASAKIGIDGDVLTAVLGDTLLSVKSFTARESGFVAGDRAQIYSNPPATAYVELEFTAPLKTLKKGEASELKTVWSLRRLTDAERANEATLIGIVRAL